MNRNHKLVEYLPSEILSEYKLCNLEDAIQTLHNPPNCLDLNIFNRGLSSFQQRLAFEELLAHRLCIRKFRKAPNQLLAPGVIFKKGLHEDFLDQLPFKLTNGQESALEDILSDLTQTTPMHRLLQGDVGSGKTVVAAIASIQAIGNGYQVALMAPTEILAEQHFNNF